MVETGDVNRPLLAVAALCGAAGVALAARGSHAAEPDVGIAANFLLIHAPALMAVALLRAWRWLQLAGWVLVLGLAIFAGDLVLRGLSGHALFTMAAPLGGIGLIVGWLGIAAGALRGNRH